MRNSQTVMHEYQIFEYGYDEKMDEYGARQKAVLCNVLRNIRGR